MKLLSACVMLICLSGLVYAGQPFDPFIVGGEGNIGIRGHNDVLTVTITGVKLANAFKDLAKTLKEDFQVNLQPPQAPPALANKYFTGEFKANAAEVFDKLAEAAGAHIEKQGDKTILVAGKGKDIPKAQAPAKAETPADKQASAKLVIESPAFKAGAVIPAKHTRYGANISPALNWSGMPKEAKELVVICGDTDAGEFTHWLMYAIPAGTKGLAEGLSSKPTIDTPKGACQGKNDFDGVGYGGPEPPSGTGVHHYRFRLFALDANLKLEPGTTKDILLRAMKKHIVAEGELIGTAGYAVEQKPAGTDINTLIKQLGDEEFSTREAASKSLIKLGEQARKPLEKLIQDTQDADICSRVNAVLHVLSMPKDFAALTQAERVIAQLPFESKVSDDGKTINFNNYGHDSDFICDFGNVRVVIEDQPYNGSSKGSFTIGEGGRSGGSNMGSFSYHTANGVTDITFRGIKWKVEGKIMKIAGQETGFGGGTNRVIFLDKAGKYKKRVDMSQEKTGAAKK